MHLQGPGRTCTTRYGVSRHRVRFIYHNTTVERTLRRLGLILQAMCTNSTVLGCNATATNILRWPTRRLVLPRRKIPSVPPARGNGRAITVALRLRKSGITQGSFAEGCARSRGVWPSTFYLYIVRGSCSTLLLWSKPL